MLEACEVREGDPAPDGSGELVAPAVSRWVTSSPWAASTESLGLKVPGPERQAADRDHGLLRRGRNPRVAAVAEGNHDED